MVIFLHVHRQPRLSCEVCKQMCQDRSFGNWKEEEKLERMLDRKMFYFFDCLLEQYAITMCGVL